MAVIALVSFKDRNGRIGAIILTLIIAFLLEWGQRYSPGRVSSVADGITNYLGLLTGMISYWFYHRRLSKR
jgi:VanZ family protein